MCEDRQPEFGPTHPEMRVEAFRIRLRNVGGTVCRRTSSSLLQFSCFENERFELVFFSYYFARINVQLYVKRPMRSLDDATRGFQSGNLPLYGAFCDNNKTMGGFLSDGK
jgi:hypothetical protein